MFGLIYKTLTYLFSSTPLNEGEPVPPPPLDTQEKHLLKEMARVKREKEALADRLRAPDNPPDDAG